jgi:hypothetical protein
VAGHRERLVDLGAERGRGQLGGRLHRQRSRAQDRHGRVAADDRVPLGRAPLRHRAHAEHEQRRHRVDAVAQEGQEAQRRLVGPVHVVDEQEQRLGGREAQHERVERVQHVVAVVERALAGHLPCPGVEQRRGRARRPGQQLRALTGGQGLERGLEELAHDAERVVALELGPPRRHDPDVLARVVVQRAQERCLPDPRDALEGDRPAGPGLCIGQGPAHQVNLVAALGKPAHRKFPMPPSTCTGEAG